MRFPGFTDEWKTTKLKTYLVENKERNAKGKFSKEQVLSVSGDKGVVNQIELLGRSYAGQSVLPYHVVYHSDIVYTKSPLSDFPYGIVKMNRGVDGVVSTLYAVYSVLGTAHPSFIEYYFASKHRTNRFFKPIVRIGAKHDMKIGNSEVLANEVTFPDIDEQIRISKFLELIDERIATQNKIIEDLKKLKSAIIEDIMNNSHAAYFTLGEVGTYVRGLTFSSDDIEDDSSALRVFRANNLNYGDYVSTKDVIYVEKIPTSPQILQPGDIVICMANGSSNLVGKNSVYNDENKFSTIGAFCGIYRTSESFVRWFLESKRYRYMVAKALQGGNGAIANLSGTDILNMKFPIITEPMKSIYNKLLTGLNNNIQTNNQLISLLLQKKAYLLKQLFI